MYPRTAPPESKGPHAVNGQFRFILPDDDATDNERWRALEIMSAVPMTIDQLERGNEVYARARHDAAVTTYAAKEQPPIGQRPSDLAHAELEKFCLAEGLLPADVAAHAMLMRYFPVEDARSGGVDLKAEYPEAFSALAAGPIDPGCMSFDDLDSIPAHIEHQWASLRIPDAELPY